MNAAATQINAGPITQIPPGEGREVLVDGRRIALFHTRSGAIYATDAVCPHRQGPLADGIVGGGTVICPLHARRFNLVTGESLDGECSIGTYQVSIDDVGNMLLEAPFGPLPS